MAELQNLSLSESWLALVIGNTHYHWAKFQGKQLIQAWDEPHPQSLNFAHLSLQAESNSTPELWLASVVPRETQRWQKYPNLHQIHLADIPLKNCYPTLGIDRALGAWGALAQYGGPLLLIDGGTALTLTGIDAEMTLQGGSILPGLGLMAHSLTQGTAALAKIQFKFEHLPTRWGLDTETAIHSGIIYTVLDGLWGFMQAWQARYPGSQIIFTGGDGELLVSGLYQLNKINQTLATYDPHVIFRGIANLRQNSNKF